MLLMQTPGNFFRAQTAGLHIEAKLTTLVKSQIHFH